MELTWTEALLKFTIAVVDALIVALIPCVVLGVRHLVGWLNSKRRLEETEEQIQRREERQSYLENLVVTCVHAVKQTYVDDLKAKAADGKLTPEERAEAMAKTMTMLRKHLLDQGMKYSDAYTSEILTDYVEEAVARLK